MGDHDRVAPDNVVAVPSNVAREFPETTTVPSVWGKAERSVVGVESDTVVGSPACAVVNGSTNGIVLYKQCTLQGYPVVKKTRC